MLIYFKHFAALMVFILLYTGLIIAQTGPSDFIHQISVTSELDAPSRMAISPSGLICVTDAYSKKIKKYDVSGNYLGTINYTGVPLSIAISDNNIIFIGDAANNKIIRLDLDGNQTVIYSGLFFPSDMVTSPDNLLYMVDGLSNKVLVMDFGGNIISNIGAGILLAPRCIAYDRQNKRIIVSEHGGVGTGFNLHSEIRIFDLTGNLLSTFGGYGNADGKFYRIQGLTIGRCGNIYVSDNFQGMISVFNANGSFITRFGQFGNQLGELNAPMDVDFDADQKLWISSMNNGALEVYSITDFLPSSQIPNSSVTVCAGEPAIIPVSFTGTPPWSFTYTINGLNPTTINNTHNNPYIITASVPGSYNITALSDTFANGSCFSGTTDVIINPAPTATITGGSTSICSGNTVDIIVSFTGSKPFSFTYTVDSINPVTINNIYFNTYIISASAPGSYAITAVSGGDCNGTSFTGTAIVAVNESPTAEISNITATLCAGQTTDIPVYFTGTAPWSFTYSIDGQSPIIINNITDNPYNLNVSLTGIYEISGISDANCSSGTFSGVAHVIINPMLTAEIMSGDTTICSGDAANIRIDFTGTGPWTFGYTIDGMNIMNYTEITSNPFFIQTSQAGTYELNSLSGSGCDGIVIPGNVVVSINPLPLAGFGYSINNMEVTFTNTTQNADTYLWDFGDGQSSNIADPVHLYSATGIYYVYLTVSNPYCSAVTIYDTIDLLLTGISTNPDESSFLIYPNPSTGIVNLEIRNNVVEELNLDITDMTGQLVYSKKISATFIKTNIDISRFVNGIYTIRVASQHAIKKEKLILVK